MAYGVSGGTVKIHPDRSDQDTSVMAADKRALISYPNGRVAYFWNSEEAV